MESSCCGTGGCGFALVPGYVLRWKASTNEKGEPVSEIEPVTDDEEKQALRKLIEESEQVQQVRRAYKVLYRSGLRLEEAREKLAEMAAEHEEVRPLIEFLDTTEKSFIR